MKRSLAAALALCAALAVTACGGSHVSTPGGQVTPQQAGRLLTHPTTANKPQVTHDVIVPVKTACPPGRATMGCAVQPSPLTRSVDVAGVTRPSGPIFPDVSSWQGCSIDWAQAKPQIYGAVAKLGEYSIDPCAQYNVSQFRKLGIRWSVYLFGRPLGCAAEIQNAETWLAAIGGPSTTGPVLVYDNEEPGLAGYALCIDRAIFAKYHRHIVVYTSAGTWSGGSAGSLDEWAAAYGPFSAPSCIWGCRVAAWQYTDGHWGYPTPISGIGSGDVSIAYHFFGTPVKPPKPPVKLRCFGKGWTHNATCDRIRQQDAVLGRKRNQELAYAKVSQHNLAVIEARLALEKRKAAEYNAQLEKSLGQYGYRHH